MIENDRQLALTKDLADDFRLERDKLVATRDSARVDRILEATIASLEGQLLRFQAEIDEYEDRVPPG